MSIEAFHNATAVFAASTVGLGIIAYSLKCKWKASQAHVASLQQYLQDQVNREGALIRKCDELTERCNALEAFETRVKTQRTNALRVAAEKRAAKAGDNAQVEAAAREKTLNALKVAPLRSRAEVVADVKRSARQVSSAG